MYVDGHARTWVSLIAKSQKRHSDYPDVMPLYHTVPTHQNWLSVVLYHADINPSLQTQLLALTVFFRQNAKLA